MTRNRAETRCYVFSGCCIRGGRPQSRSERVSLKEKDVLLPPSDFHGGTKDSSSPTDNLACLPVSSASEAAWYAYVCSLVGPHGVHIIPSLFSLGFPLGTPRRTAYGKPFRAEARAVESFLPIDRVPLWRVARRIWAICAGLGDYFRRRRARCWAGEDGGEWYDQCFAAAETEGACR